MSKKRFYLFIGTTAEFNKLVPVIKELKNRKLIFKIIDSGQNSINYKDFEGYIGKIKPDITLITKTDKSSVIIFFLWAIRAFIFGFIKLRKEFNKQDKKNCYFIIHGDTVTSSIGGILAKLFRLKLVHIESGYFSFNYFEPFPEEICKNINVRLADILFPPTTWTYDNLKKFNKVKINTQYNTNIESFWWSMKKRIEHPKTKIAKPYYLLIIHRQEHVIFKKEWTKDIMEYVIKNSKQNITCVILSHPLTNEIINSLRLGKHSNKINIIPQVSYPEFLKVLENSEYIATDSATMQQETFYMGKPHLSLADYSVQTEGLGENAVICKSDKSVIKDFLINYKKYRRKPKFPQKSPAKIIIDYLASN